MRLAHAGVWGNLAGVAPASAIFISVYEPVKQMVEKEVSEDQVRWGSLPRASLGSWLGAAVTLEQL